MGRRVQRRKKKNNKTYLLFFIVILLIFLVVKSAAKFVMQEVGNPVAQESTEFYFNSEIANTDGKNFKYNYWNGENTKKIEIDVINYLNNLLQTNEEISYQINAEIIDDEADEISDADLIDIKLLTIDNLEISTNQELTIDNQELICEKYYLEIIPKNEIEEGKTFNIKLSIKSNAPYEKNITSNIEIIVDKPENTYNLTASENGEYVTLNLNVKNVDNDIKIEFDSTKLILDKSSFILNDIAITEENGIKSFTISKEILEERIYEINFIKLQDEIILDTDIIIN